MAKPKKDRKDRLAALKKKLETTDMGGGQKGWWSPPEGKSIIRIMPEVGDMDFFFQEVGRHYMPDKSNIYCPNFTSGGDLDCPICELTNDLYRQGDKASKAMAGDLRVRKGYWMNIIDRDNEDVGPLIFTPGVTIFGAIVGYINDPEYGDIFDEYDGTDLIIERKGKGMETEYQVRAARNVSQLSDDDALMDKWFEEARELVVAEASMDEEEDKDIDAAIYLWPYERIGNKYDFDSLFDDDEFEDEDDGEEEVHPVKRDVSQRRARRARR